MNWQRKNSTIKKVQKRDLASLNANCDSEIIHWSKVKGVAVTVFLPWVSTAKALGELAHLERWVAKQANLTSNALAGLLSDEEVTRQAMLQNRAAINDLLLLHGHRCEEFEGLCCFNLLTKAEDVHKAIQSIRGMVEDIKKETGDWLRRMFGNWGISGWYSLKLHLKLQPQALRKHPYRKTTHHKGNHLQEEAEGQEKPKHQLPQHDAASDCARWHLVEEEQEKEEKEACQLARLHGRQEKSQAEEELEIQKGRAVSSMPFHHASD
ncbi:hypothetical protein DUI87_03788 [Hirundo rustica rustica]|uniref:Uncharacterized protein n=1 Tax=Hirundo rustica rustica TaxID=333673 RepID=A0A3M0L1G9_HIRRU|nr:hypothetical protein DUI87_03788 [Hirundo rustica rustica]